MSTLHLARLEVVRTPGLPDGLPALDLAPGVNVVLGPNASGKSTVARVLRDLLWPAGATTGDQVDAVWRGDDGRLTARLFAGQVSWDPAAPDPPPGGAELSILSMAGLLEVGAGADGTIAARIARQLAGGLDLGAVERDLGEVKRLSANTILARDRRDAAEALRAANRAAKDLGVREERLEQLDLELEAARRAKTDHDACLALLKRLDAERVLAEARVALDGFPAALEHLRGDEADELERLDGERRGKRAARDAARRKLEPIVARLEDQAAAGEPPEPADLKTWEARAEGLVELDRRRGELDEELARGRAAVETARSVLVGDPDADARGLGAEGLDALAVGLDKQREAQGRAEAQREAASLWRTWTEVPDGEPADPGDLEEAIRALRRWLRAGAGAEPGVGGLDAATWRGLRVGLLLVALVTLLAALAGLLELLPPTAGIAAAVATGLLAVLLARTWGGGSDAAAPDDERARAGAAVRACALDLEPGPEPWDPAALAARLDGLERRRDAVEAARRAADRADGAQAALEQAEAEAARLAAELADELRAAGLAEGLAGMGAVEQAGALGRLREAEAAAAAATAARDTVARELATGLADLAADLAPHGVAAPTDPVAARAACRALAKRREALLKDRKDRQELVDQLAGLEADLEGLDGQADAIWARADLDDGEPGAPAALDRLLDRLADYEIAGKALAEAESRLRLRVAECEELGPPSHLDHQDDLGAVTREEVEAWRDEDREAADGYEQLVEVQARIRADLEQARGGTTLTDAIAAVEAAEERVAAERDRTAERAVAHLVLDDVRRGHESEQAPELLKRARERFARFTDRRWHLELDGEQRLAVRDASTKQQLGLEQLSDGTRIQLLLAARLTALEELEGAGPPLPIALDEALATSDPRRFRAIAEALFAVAAEGRQVLYLTADPAEAAQWRAAAEDLDREPPNLIPLGGSPGADGAWPEGLPATPPDPVAPPDPTGHDADSYAAVRGVVLPDGFAEPAGWDLFLVAHDDLEVLVACLGRRIETLGHWAATLEADELPAIEPEALARIEARRALAETCVPLWRTGRGRPVTWDDVLASGVVTEAFEQGLRDALAEHGRDPAAFLLAATGLKRFRTNSKEALAETLEDAGCLPAEDPLEEAELVRRTLAAAPAATETLGAPAADAYVTWLARLVEA